MFSPESAIHFVGIGGIGMSGLAQMCKAMGATVSGSDRAIDNPENRRIFDRLKAQGISLYRQDGSGVVETRPDFLVYSTAIEDDNPDFVAAGEEVIRLHRSEALSMAMAANKQQMIAVTGSCGKTTVSSWLAESLHRAGLAPSFLAGGLVNSFIGPARTGNYGKGEGDYFVFEADESDKSLLAYHPDYSLILNIGTDHYSKDELIDVFQQFLRQTKKGAVIEKSLLSVLGDDCMKHLNITVFDADGNSDNSWDYSNYCSANGEFKADFGSIKDVSLPMPGRHNASNASAVLASFAMLGVPIKRGIPAVSEFQGVWRRFDYAGKLSTGARVYDDYAHNVEKLVSCIHGARQILNGRIIAIFQPHGFGPLKFMRDELFRVMEEELGDEDVLALLPVYYAGGTAAFTPTSNEVIESYQKTAKKTYKYFDSRADAVDFLEKQSNSNDIVLIMGARDNSLSDWAAEIARL